MLPEIQTHLEQLKWLLIILIALVCPLLALMLGGTTVSLASASLKHRTGEKETPTWIDGLLRRANPSVEHDALVVLTIIASLLLFKIIYRPQLFSNAAWIVLILLLTAGLGLMVCCRYRLVDQRPLDRTALAIGGAGVTIVAACCLALACTESILLTPEFWPHLSHLPYLFLSWHGFTRFAEFLLLTCAITGNALLFSTTSPYPTSIPPPAADCVARRIGAGLSLGALLLWPLALGLEMALIPSLAGGRLLTALAVASILLAAFCTFLLGMTLYGKMHAPKTFFAMIILLFWCWAFMGHVARERTLTPVALAGLAVETPTPALATEGESIPPEVSPSKAAKVLNGKELFEQKCSVCHRFDQRVVGPPLNSVVPGYRSDPETLTAFLMQPVKRNPDYPAMPNLGLTADQAEAIADYLFQNAEP